VTGRKRRIAHGRLPLASATRPVAFSSALSHVASGCPVFSPAGRRWRKAPDEGGRRQPLFRLRLRLRRPRHRLASAGTSPHGGRGRSLQALASLCNCTAFPRATPPSSFGLIREPRKDLKQQRIFPPLFHPRPFPACPNPLIPPRIHCQPWQRGGAGAVSGGRTEVSRFGVRGKWSPPGDTGEAAWP